MKACAGWRRFHLCFPLVFILPHLFSVLELHQNRAVTDAPKENTKKFDVHDSLKKFDHLVLGPAAGEGFPNRLQCRGVKALNKTHFSNSSHASGDCICSVLIFEPNRVTVLPIQGEYSRDKLMLQRISSYIAFLEIKLEKLRQEQGGITHFIITDSDIAVIDDLGLIFEQYQDFHLALTFRNNKDQPLNSGFIAVRGTHEGILRAKNFLEKVLESDASFDAKRFSKAQGFTKEIGGASVLFLPCATYNWTPPEGAGQFHGMPLDVKVVHFKGSRKRLMLEAWNYFCSSTDISDMLCLILKSGRTKYDF
ncbi:hypothetical protein like AT2G45320 [Hibiscus trionum]|uniref:Nucleotide-diphospho-sugar transferase domain-containing protein n=1 Tax=Hibiscus trionum TaxID=183268 RepID=A0A9W7IJ72_HIBTR|nr:hypothetical protein like AT2G45320 [Hibiscus trionum]